MALKALLVVAASAPNMAQTLFFSEYAEGSSHNKFLEIFNPTNVQVSLDGYAYPSVANAPATEGVHEFWNAFDSGASVPAGGVYVICHGSADDSIKALCDEEHTYLSNGNDGYCLVQGTESNYTFIDCVGDFYGDPGSGWDVCGVSAATKDNTLVRKSTVTTGNGGDWTASAGTNEADCEWLVEPKDTWNFLGSHAMGVASPLPPSLPPAPPLSPSFGIPSEFEDDGTDAQTLFFSEYAEGSSHNKFLEIFNPTDVQVSLDGYAYPSVANAPATEGVHEFWNAFDSGASVPAGGVYVICHGSADDSIKALCDEEHTYLSNGNDGYCLVQGTESNYTFIDCVGDFYGDPGSGWDVCGVSAATKDNTLVRKSTVTTGNGGDWTASAGTNEVDCEWLVEPKDTWNFLGSHAMGVASPLPPSLPPAPPLSPSFGIPSEFEDDGTDAQTLFFSEYAEGSSHNKFLEIFNPTNVQVSLDGYAYPSVANAPATEGVHEFWNAFDSGASVPAGGVYVICHGSADDSIKALCDEEHTYLSNGNDGYCLVQGTESNYTFIDCVGDFYGDPGSGWDVCGVSAATKDNTLVRKSTVTTGNGGDWTASAGTNEDDCEWLVEPKDTWNFLGSHAMGVASPLPPSLPPAPPLSPSAPPTPPTPRAPNVVDAQTLFFSEYAEGSSHNKFLEIFNPTNVQVSLDGYAYPSVANAPATEGVHEFWNAFDSGASVPAGGVYVICHGSADDSIKALCDEEHTYLSNGNDGYCLVQGTESNYTFIDCVGDFYGDPGSGWDVCGVSAATKDNTLVRKSTVTTGNGGDWTASAGTNEADCEWLVEPKDTWNFLGSHAMGVASPLPPLPPSLPPSMPPPSTPPPVAMPTTLFAINTNHSGSDGACYHSAREGEFVRVEGYVTGVSYDGFYMQDEVAAALYAGVWVYTGSGSSYLTNLTAGDKVGVEALVNEYYSLTELLVADTPAALVELLSTGHTPLPLATTTGAIGEGCTESGEAHEGLLVTVSGGVQLLSEANNYGEITIDDGSGPTQLEDSMLRTEAHLQSILGATSLTGQSVSSVTGVIKYAFSSFEIHPRDESDIVLVSPPPPLPPPPPTPPLAPLPPGGEYTPAVVFTTTLDGDMTTFDSAAYAANLAELVGVSPDSITLEISSVRRARALAAFTVTATVITASTAIADTIQITLAALSPEEASTALGVTVTAVEEPVVSSVVVIASPPPPTEPERTQEDAGKELTDDDDNNVDEGGLNGGTIAAIVVACVLALVIGIAIGAMIFKRRKGKKASLGTAVPVEMVVHE